MNLHTPTTPGAGTPPSLSPSLFLHAWHLNYQQPIVWLVAFLAFVGFSVWLWLQLRSEQGTVSAGGMSYVVGPMGSGKSMFGVRLIVGTLRRGKYAVTNVRLLPGWEDVVAKRLFPRERSAEKRAARAAWLRGFYIYEPVLTKAMRYRLPCAYCGGDVNKRNDSVTAGPSEDAALCNHVGPENEGRAVVVWDETHNDLNNRDYQGHGQDRDQREQEKERRRLILRWATQLRKIGYAGYLLSQHQENTDAQLRRVCNYIIRLQNQRTRGIGVLLPKRLALFLVYWYPAHLADGTTRVESVRKERYFLPWQRNLYDSWEVFHGLDSDLSADSAPIYLPHGGRKDLAPEAPSNDGGGATPSGPTSTVAPTKDKRRPTRRPLVAKQGGGPRVASTYDAG